MTPTTTPRMSFTLALPDGQISFAVLGNISMQYDRAGQHIHEHQDFENACVWVLNQIHYFRIHQNGTIISGYDSRFFENPWEWPNRS